MKKYFSIPLLLIFAIGFWFKEMGPVTYNNQACTEYRAVANDNSVKWYLTKKEPNEVLYIRVIDDKGNVSRLRNIDLPPEEEIKNN